MTQDPQQQDFGLGAVAEAALLQRALAHQQAGRWADAALACREILALNPDQPQALLMLGLILGREIDPTSGAALIARYLEQFPDDPYAAYSLGMLRQRQHDPAAALALFDRALARAPAFGPAFQGRAIALQELGQLDAAAATFAQALDAMPTDATTRNNFGDLLRLQGRLDAALAEFDRAIAADPGLAVAQLNRGIVLAELGRAAEAIAALRQALALDPGLIRAHLELAEALDALWQPADAQRHRNLAVRQRPLVVEPALGPAPEARVLIVGSAGRADVSVEFLFHRRRFSRIKLLLLAAAEGGAGQAALLDQLPAFDIAFNAIADADRGAPFLPAVAMLAARHDGRLLNHPERIAPTRRDRLAETLAGIAGLVVPDTRRLEHHALARLVADGESFARPRLVRPVGDHGGAGLRRVDHPDELAAYLAETTVDTHYLTDFWDFQSPDGRYRKYRFIFVDRVAYPYHLVIGQHWKLHYFRVDMNEAPWMKREEEDFLADYECVFPGPLGETVRAVGARLDLDYAGMDCGITPDGRVLLFEANANMLVHLNDSPEGFAYKHRYVPRILDAVAALAARRIAAAPPR